MTERFKEQCEAVKEYIAAIKQARTDMDNMSEIIISQFRTKLFEKIKEISQKAVEKLGYSKISPEVAFLQIYHSDRSLIHLEWLLEGDMLQLEWQKDARIPFYFHLENKNKNELVGFIFEEVKSKLLEPSNEEACLVWEDSSFEIRIEKKLTKNNLLVVKSKAESSISVADIEKWLPELLACPPIQALIQLLGDENFWGRKEIKALLS